jgi:hypothetical protein
MLGCVWRQVANIEEAAAALKVDLGVLREEVESVQGAAGKGGACAMGRTNFANACDPSAPFYILKVRLFSDSDNSQGS